MVWGEFGRTPTINKDGGRDHWPRVSCALLAGGGMKTGQVIGSTDRLGGEATNARCNSAKSSPRFITTSASTSPSRPFTDLTGRPQFLVDGYAPMKELVG